jgi:hypothetical protein
MPVHLVIDHDFRSPADLAQIHLQAKKESLVLHVLQKKEIENYFVNAETISRLIAQRSLNWPSVKEIEALIMEAANEAGEAAISAIADQWQYDNKGKSASSAFDFARKAYLAETKMRSVQDVVSGKKLISLLSKKCKERYGVSFGPMTLCKTMFSSEFDPELHDLIKALS